MPRNFEDTGATHRSAEECERIAHKLRLSLGCGEGEPLPPIIVALENARSNITQLKELELIVRSDHEMNRAHAIAHPEKKEIDIRDSDVDAIMQNTPEIRFAILHETIHILLHTGQDKFFRIIDGNIIYPFLSVEASAEWQADRIARAILMPPEMVARTANPLELANISESPLNQAIVRVNELASKNGKLASQSIANAISKLRLTTAATSAEVAKREAEDQKLVLWSDLPCVEGEDPRNVRLCGRYQIFWDEFGKTTACGWFIEKGKIRTHYERYDI